MDREGRILEVQKAHNLAVNNCLVLARDLFGGTGFRPDKMEAGTGTGATTPSMNALENSVISKFIDRRVNLTYGIEFQALIENDEANGYTLSELGTFKGTLLLARALITPTIEKTSSIQVLLSHIFTFSAG